MNNVKCVRECFLSFFSLTPTGLYTFLSIRTVLVPHRTFWWLLDYPHSPPTPARQNKNQSPPYEESTVDHWLHHYMLLYSKVFLNSKNYRSKTKHNRQVQKHKNRMTKKAMLRRSVDWGKKKKKGTKKRSKLTSYS
jgi:hypothetical protein